VSIHRSGTTRTPLRVVRIPRRGRHRVLGIPHPYTARRSPRTLPKPATRAGYRCPACSDCMSLYSNAMPKGNDNTAIVRWILPPFSLFLRVPYLVKVHHCQDKLGAQWDNRWNTRSYNTTKRSSPHPSFREPISISERMRPLEWKDLLAHRQDFSLLEPLDFTSLFRGPLDVLKFTIRTRFHRTTQRIIRRYM